MVGREGVQGPGSPHLPSRCLGQADTKQAPRLPSGGVLWVCWGQSSNRDLADVGAAPEAELCQARSSPDGTTVTGPPPASSSSAWSRALGRHELPHSETRDSSSLSEST